jgi:hypothetical protein
VGAADLARSGRASAATLTAGLIGGAALLAVVNAVAIAVAVPLPVQGITLRIAHHVFDAAETLGVAAAFAAIASALRASARLPAWAEACVALGAAFGGVYWLFGQYFAVVAARRFEGRVETPLFVACLVLLSVALAGAPFVASLCRQRPRLRFVPVVLASTMMIGTQVPVRDDYPGLHCIAVTGAVFLVAPCAAPSVERVARALAQSRAGQCALAAALLLAIAGVTVPPSNAVRFELFRQPCAVAPWVLATLVWRGPGVPSLAPPPPLSSPGEAQATPPTAPALLPPDAVVVLITVDALRADVVDDPANDSRLPALATLKREGVHFTHASAPGTQTVISLGTLFSGAYFSEQRWTRSTKVRSSFVFPDDPRPRLPQLLSERGVATAQAAGLPFLRGDFGIASGFHDETVLSTREPGSRLIASLLARLAQTPRGPAFLYTHLHDLHEPYGGRAGHNEYAQYLDALTAVDKQLDRVLRFLEQHYGERWALFVSADHGEAFGEHETWEHSKTLYEELLHVPLLARSPRFVPQTVSDRVGLVDLGPTLLDLFGVPTPPSWNGQSLVPLLAGGKVAFTRPLLAEGRLRRALTLPSGFKVIEDHRRKVVEAYDLFADPGERFNLFDIDPARADPALAALRSFFAAHASREGGYEPPYFP